MPDLLTVRVLSVRHYTPALFSFRTERPQGFRFRAGEFVMIGLINGDEPLLRAYSICSAPWDDHLEFLSIVAPGGALTQRLGRIQEGDGVVLRGKSTGTLVLDTLEGGDRLWLFATGTGFAPFASLLRDQEAHRRFSKIYVVHTCRNTKDLTFSAEAVTSLKDPVLDAFLGEGAYGRVRYIPTTTREKSEIMGRSTDLLDTGALFDAAGAGPLDSAKDRVMVCGSLTFNLDMKRRLVALGFEEGSVRDPGTFALEKAFTG